MSFIDVNLDDVPEIDALPEGEYQLRVTETPELREKNNSKFILVRLEAVDHPNSKDITHVQFLPRPDDREKDKARTLGQVRDFCQAFGVDFSGGGFNLEDFVGETAWAVLGEEESAQYGRQNRVVRWVKGA